MLSNRPTTPLLHISVELNSMMPFNVKKGICYLSILFRSVKFFGEVSGGTFIRIVNSATFLTSATFFSFGEPLLPFFSERISSISWGSHSSATFISSATFHGSNSVTFGLAILFRQVTRFSFYQMVFHLQGASSMEVTGSTTAEPLRAVVRFLREERDTAAKARDRKTSRPENLFVN